jgi:hypothetical protein
MGERLVELSLLGGPLHRLGSRLGLVRSETNTLPLGLALGLSTWSILMLLAFIEGTGRQLFSLSLAAGHARMLVAIPLFFLGETLVDPWMRRFGGFLRSSGIVLKRSLPAVEADIARTRRWSDSWLPEALCLLAAVLMSWAAPTLPLPGATAAYDPARAAAGFSLTEWWYWAVALTLFRFLIFRWLWRLALWCHFLWRVSRLDLLLVPAHPDRVAGLGILEIAHMRFAPLIMATSAVVSASFAENLSTGAMSFTALVPPIEVMLALDAVLFVGPLMILSPRLLASRVQGKIDYMRLAARYVRDFDSKWIAATPPEGKLLGTEDLQSLADLDNSVSIVKNMRMAPVSRRLLTLYAVAAALPLLPLFLFKYPLAHLVREIFTRLAGF